MNTTKLDTSFEGSFKIPDTDRTSPDGQEKEKEQTLLFKSSIEYETELKTLVDKVTVLLEENTLNNEKLKDLIGLQEKNKELEESLDMIREEFENMEPLLNADNDIATATAEEWIETWDDEDITTDFAVELAQMRPQHSKQEEK